MYVALHWLARMWPCIAWHACGLALPGTYVALHWLARMWPCIGWHVCGLALAGTHVALHWLDRVSCISNLQLHNLIKAAFILDVGPSAVLCANLCMKCMRKGGGYQGGERVGKGCEGLMCEVEDVWEEWVDECEVEGMMEV